jgi:hypothetical protein
VSAGGNALKGVDDLFDALDAAPDALVLGVVRGTEEQELEVALGQA